MAINNNLHKLYNHKQKMIIQIMVIKFMMVVNNKYHMQNVTQKMNKKKKVLCILRQISLIKIIHVFVFKT